MILGLAWYWWLVIFYLGIGFVIALKTKIHEVRMKVAPLFEWKDIGFFLFVMTLWFPMYAFDFMLSR